MKITVWQPGEYARGDQPLTVFPRAVELVGITRRDAVGEGGVLWLVYVQIAGEKHLVKQSGFHAEQDALASAQNLASEIERTV